MPDRVVLDAHAVLAFLGEEQGWAEVEDILRTGEPWMTLVSIGEVAYILERTSGAGAASVLDCPVLTGDPEFRAAEELGVTVRWLGRQA
ncbi:MAG: PIN domain-containing protein [Acidimicrobiales bacterium]